MKLSLTLLLVCLMLAIGIQGMVLVETYSPLYMTYSSCQSYIEETATVCFSAEYSFNYTCFCNFPLGFGTMSDCLIKGFNNDTNIIDQYAQMCSETGTTMTRNSFYEKHDKFAKDMKNVTKIKGFNLTLPFDHPVILDYDSPMFKIMKDSTFARYNNLNYGFYFGVGSLGYWALVLIIGGIVNWTTYLFPNALNFFTGKISNNYRRYISLSALFHKKKTHERTWIGIFDHLIPSRMETIIVVGFLVYTVIGMSLNIDVVYPNSTYTSKSALICGMVGIRLGDIVCFHIPLLVLFAGRNNFLQWVTRWNFATFITYHRWISRLAIIIVIIHAITYSTSDIIEGYYKYHFQYSFMHWGTVATVSGGFILFQGMMFFRRRWYEVFLLIHIVLATLFIVGGYYHVDFFGYAPCFWSCVAVWGFDRVIRIVRLISFGAPKAKVTLLAEETLKVVIPKPRYWKSIPGGHAFVHFGKLSCFWQSHPFTFTETDDDNNDIVLYMKLKGGVTHGLYQKLLRCPDRTSFMRVCVEGPYGEPSGAKRYKNVVYVAGGNGIPGIYSETYDLAKRDAKQTLKLLWVIREWKSVSWFYDELKKLNNTKVETTIYITRPDNTNSIECFRDILADDSSVDEKEKEKTLDGSKEKDYEVDSQSENCNFVDSIKSNLPHINFIEGRPSIYDMVEQEVRTANGTIAFVTCGHPVMVDEIRHAVIQNLDNSKHRVEFFEQLQVWA